MFRKFDTLPHRNRDSCLTLSEYTTTGPTSPITALITPGKEATIMQVCKSVVVPGVG